MANDPLNLRNRIVGHADVDPRTLVPNEANWRKHPQSQMNALHGALGDIGWVTEPIVNRTTGRLIDGHARVELAINEPTIPVTYVELSLEEERKVLATLDPIGAMAEADADLLADLLESIETHDANMLEAIAQVAASNDIELMPDDGLTADDILAQLAADQTADQEAEVELGVRDVPDAVWPTNNVWGVPTLDITMQADAVDLPVNAWGSIGKKSKMIGTYHFYTDDHRFDTRWRNPTPIVNAGTINVVEPNYSTNLQMPKAVVLWHTYRKRWLARYWQSKGIRVFVDLDVNPEFKDINLLGVPKGWRAYACYMREAHHKEEHLDMYLAQAQEHAEAESVLLMVVGGSKAIQAKCEQSPYCIFVPDFGQAFYHNYYQRTVK